MIKARIVFTALLLGSAFFTIITSASHLHEHSSHLFLTLIPQLLFLGYLWRDKIGFSFKAQKGIFTGLVFLSLFLFISTHVIPSAMLLDHHGHTQTTEHKSEHPCCLPVLPPAPVTGVGSVIGYMQEMILEPEVIHAAAPIFSDNSRSPPLV